MKNENQFIDHGEATKDLTQAVANKIKYLQILEDAINRQDDRKVYELINPLKYSAEVSNLNVEAQNSQNDKLVDDIHAKLSAFLSQKLLKYLKEMYPFFYFEETPSGDFQFYFGNWWGRRLFGTVDILNVEFHFDQEEYKKLSRAFELEYEDKRLNSDAIERLSEENEHLQDLIDCQDKRDEQKQQLREQIKQISQEKVMPWESSKQKQLKQKLVDQLSHLTELDEEANDAYRIIHENEETVLNLSKEDTLIGYEKQSIVSKFGSFENFEAKNKILYRDYIASLIATENR